MNRNRKAVEPNNKRIGVYRQCELSGFTRSSLYYKPRGDTEYNEMLMRMIDRHYVETPFCGIDKMTEYLCRESYHVNHKRVRRLMRQMGLEAAYLHRKRGLSISEQAAQDIPVVAKRCCGYPRGSGVVGGYNIHPYGTRVALSCGGDGLVQQIRTELGNISDAGVGVLRYCFATCIEFWQAASFSTDQGSQFTSDDFTTVLLGAKIQISMDGSGRVFDNIFVERLWRS